MTEDAAIPLLTLYMVMLLGLCMSLAARIKQKTLIRNTGDRLCHERSLESVYGNRGGIGKLPLIWKSVLAVLGVTLVDWLLGELSLGGYYYDLVNTKVSDLLEKNPACTECVHLPACCGGCMVESITEDGDYLVPDQRCCYFHKHIGEQAVREIADAAILAAGLKPA